MATKCVGPECARPPVAHDLCGSHYRQWLRRRRRRDKLTPLRLVSWVKLPGVHVTPGAFKAIRSVNRNAYRAVQSILEEWAKGRAA